MSGNHNIKDLDLLYSDVSKLINEIVLDVLADNPRAIHLYEKMGFEKMGDIFPGFSNPEEEKPDVFTMQKSLL